MKFFLYDISLTLCNVTFTMDDNFFFVACFFLLNSLRYIFFGLWNEFNSTFFNYVQFIVFNNHLNKNEYYGIASDITFWVFFGLSPHPNSDGSIDHIYHTLYGDSDDDSNYNSTSRRILSDNNTANDDTNNDKLQEINDWFNDNKFLITSTVLFTIIAITFMGYMIYAIINIYYNKQLKNIINRDTNNHDTVMIRDGSVYNINKNRWNTSYYSFLIKAILIAYCNLATITIAQILDINTSSFELGFLTIIVFLFLIGFPMYIFIVLNNNTSGLYRQDFMDKFGPLYLHFKSSPMNINFMILILAKQLLYAVAINLNSNLTYTQNSVLLGINIIFLTILCVYKPYAESLYQLQAVCMCVSMIILSFVNYAILSSTNDNTLFWLSMLNMIVHVVSISCLVIIQIYAIIKEHQMPKIETHDLSNDGVKLVMSRNGKSEENLSHVDEVYNPEYKRVESKRFARVVGDTLTNIV